MNDHVTTDIDADVESVHKGLKSAGDIREEGLLSAGNSTGLDKMYQSGDGEVNAETFGAMGTTVRTMIAYARPVRSMIIVAMVLAVFSSVLTVISPEYLSKITDEITQGIRAALSGDVAGTNMNMIRHLTFIYIALIVGSFLFNYIQASLMVSATQRTAQRMRTDMDRKIDRMPLSYFDKNSFGDTLSRMTNDIDTLSQTLNNSVATLMTGFVMIVGTAVMMFITEWRMALAGIVTTIVGFILSSVILVISQKHFVAQQRQLGALNGHIEESFSGHSVVRVHNAEEDVREEFDARNDALYVSSWKAQFLSGLMFPLMMFIGNFGYVVVCVVGAILVMNGSITVGVIVAFMVYIRLFTHPLGQIAEAATSFQSAAAAGTRIFELFEEEEMEDESSKPSFHGEVRGEVEFRDVRFSYVKGQEIIHGFSAKVKAGQKVAIVGPTGAGKTTLVNLLMRFYDVDSGDILIDGKSTRCLRREDVDAMFAMVLQDTWMFEGTLRENIVYRTEGVSEDRLACVIDEVGLRSMVSQLPQGLDTVMNESTVLSAGQKQLVTIARAMIADSPLLILDEATSSIDTRTEVLIQAALDAVTVGRTSFVIAHRLSTIRNADVIFVMKGGDIVETGTHEELLAAQGAYAELYNSQFDSEQE